MSANEIEATKIGVSALQPGDVLLSRGIGDLSDLICASDGGSYSHAAVWDGENVIEATLGGIAANPVDLGLDAMRYIDVYRFRRDGAWLGTPQWPAKPVVDQAKTFVGGKYAYADLMMAAVVLALGRKTNIPALKLVIARIGKTFASQITKRLSTVDSGIDPKVCTEVVVSAYYDAVAQPPNRYGLEVVVRGRVEAPMEESLAADDYAETIADYEEMSQQCRELVANLAPAVEPMLEPNQGDQELFFGGLTADRTVVAGSSSLPASSVTPRDLETSPSLAKIGRLSVE